MLVKYLCPLQQLMRIGLTFDPDLWTTNLNIYKDHLPIKDYLPTKFEASGMRFSLVIICTRFEKPTWPLNVDILTWKIGIFQSSRTIYLPCLKLLGKVFLSYQLHKVWEKDMTLTIDLLTWISIGIIYSSRIIYLPSLKLLEHSILELSVGQHGQGRQTDRHEQSNMPLLLRKGKGGGVKYYTTLLSTTYDQVLGNRSYIFSICLVSFNTISHIPI